MRGIRGFVLSCVQLRMCVVVGFAKWAILEV